MIKSIPIKKFSKIRKTELVTDEEIMSLHIEIEKIMNTQSNFFYKNFDSEFIINYMLNNLYERDFNWDARIEFHDNCIMLVQGEYDYGTLYAHIFAHTDIDCTEFLRKNVYPGLGGDRLTLVIVPLYAKQMLKYKSVVSYDHHLLPQFKFMINDHSNDGSDILTFLKLLRKPCNCAKHENFNYDERECDLKDWKNIFSECQSVFHIGMIKINVLQ